jgi:hypothetical protein
MSIGYSWLIISIFSSFIRFLRWYVMLTLFLMNTAMPSVKSLTYHAWLTFIRLWSPIMLWTLISSLVSLTFRVSPILRSSQIPLIFKSKRNLISLRKPILTSTNLILITSSWINRFEISCCRVFRRHLSLTIDRRRWRIWDKARILSEAKIQE